MRKLIAILFILCFAAGLVFVINTSSDHDHTTKFDQERKKKIARAERLHQMLQDPATGKIPKNARLKELAFSSQIPKPTGAARLANNPEYNWQELGPSDVGGRVRSIALDTRNSDIVLVGAASGGIWRSANGGETWTAVLPSGSNLAISSIAQDAINSDIWYASTGEIDGGTAFIRQNFSGFYGGNGLYKSEDNGQSWQHLTYTVSENGYVAQSEPSNVTRNSNSSPFVLTNKLLTHDFNGTSTLFLTTQFWGIWFSNDNGQSFSKFGLSLNEDPEFTDIIVDDNDVITIYSGPTSSDNTFGFFRSYDGGGSYSDITPSSFSASTNARSVLAFAPSSQGVIYAFTHLGNDESSLLKFDFTEFDAGNAEGPSITDHTSLLPTYPESIFSGDDGNPEPANFTTQNGYDMTIAVHPNDPDFVLLGYVELIRSDDGFSSALTNDPGYTWIGGNVNPTLRDENPPIVFSDDFKHHADQHVILFDPNDPNVVWSGHDGGLSKTVDITANRVAWTSMNNDFNVTQFYHISVGGTKFVGGTQDNGTPLLDFENFDGALVSSSGDLSSGDGAYSFIGANHTYVSSQNGNLNVRETDGFDIVNFVQRSDLSPRFIHPFAVDPSNDVILYYPAGDGRGTVGRYNDASIFESPDWTDLDLNNGLLVTAIKVTNASPASRLYVGGIDTEDGNSVKLMALDDASTSTSAGFATYEIPGIAAGAWMNDIGINPVDGNEILLAFSNYNIDGLAYSSDGGNSFSIVEGNLGNNDGISGITGPSIRSAEIVELSNGSKKYIVGTSIGIFSTSSMEGSNTVWTSEFSQLDNVIVEDLDQRPDDHAIVVGTHGRGAFLGSTSDIVELSNLTAGNLTIVNQDESTELEVGDVLTLAVSFTNTGSAPTGSGFTASFQKDGTDIGTATFSESVLPEETGTLSFTLTESESAPGTFTYSVQLDTENAIAETDELDNTASSEIEVVQPLPNLKFNSITIRPIDAEVIEVDQRTEIVIEVENDGDIITEDPFIISFTSENYFFSTTLLATIEAGTSETYVGFGDPFPAAGEFVVTGMLDVDNEIIETNEDDNSFTTTVTVSEAILSTSAGSQIEIYPNPADDHFTISGAPGKISNIYESIQLFDLSGKAMVVSKSVDATSIGVDVSQLKRGTYLLRYQLDEKTHSMKIIVNH